MHDQVSKSPFKAKALELSREVEATGKPVIVTDHGKPSVEVRKYHDKHRDPLTTLKGSVSQYVPWPVVLELRDLARR